MLKDLVLKNRSYRRFYQNEPVSMETLRELVELARNAPSGRNMQPIKYMLIADPQKCAQIFPTLAWAGYLKDWGGPIEGERPAAYIVMLGDTELSKSFGVDQGIAAQTILLGATEKGLGGCMVGNILRVEFARLMGIEPRYEVLLVLALGKPKETVVLEPVGADGDIKYYRDEQAVHHVPKRSMKEIVLQEY